MKKRWRSEWLVYGLLLGLAVVLRFYRLDAEGFWLDEVMSLRQAPSSILDALGKFWTFEGIGRSISLLPLGIALKFGNSEFIARLPYAIFSVLDVAALYFVVRKLRDLSTARLAMALLALSPLHVWYAQEVRWYAQWSLWTTLSFLALVYAWKTDRRTAWSAYVVAIVVNLCTFVLSTVVTAMHALTGTLLAWFEGNRRFAIKQYASLFLACVLAAPAFYAALHFQDPGGDRMDGPVGTPRALTLFELPYTFYAYVVGYSLGPTVGELHYKLDPAWVLRTYPETLLFGAIAIPLLVAAVRALRSDRPAAAVLLPWAVLFPVSIFLVSGPIGQTFNVRYTFAALPGFVVLLAIGARSFSRPSTRTVAAAAITLLFGASLASYYWNPRYGKEHVREAVSMIAGSPYRDAPVAFVGQGAEVVQHYGPQLSVREVLECDRSPGTAATGGDTELREAPVVWLLVSRDWSRAADRCLDVLRDTHETVEHREFIGADLWRFETAGRPPRRD